MKHYVKPFFTRSKLIFYCFLLVNVVPVFSQQWGTTGYIPPAARFDDIYFIDSLAGWTVNSSGEIYKTTDGGDTWEKIFEADRYLRSVEFLDDKTGFAGSLGDLFLQTVDGGTTWQEIQHRIPATINGICGLSHIDDNVYGVGVWSAPAYFIKSTDRGETWSYKDMFSQANALIDCYFLNENVGFITGSKSGGVILKTTDSGETWKEVHNTDRPMEYVWKLFFVTDSIAYASIESFIGNTAILKTTDAGESWNELKISERGLDIQGIGFINKDTGWVSSRGNAFFETNDGGATWKEFSAIANINRFFKVSDTKMFASGSIIYKYDDAISFGLSIDTTSVHEILELKPNPFSDELFVKIRLDVTTHVKLDLISIDGKQVISLHDGLLNAGKHIFQLNEDELVHLKKGIHILYFRTNERFLSRKIIKTG